MKKLIILLFTLSGFLSAFSQDEITLRNGETIKAKVLEVGVEDISYKKSENPTGPSYTVKKDKVFMIKYENGAKDVFEAVQNNNAAPANAVKSEGPPAIIYFFRPGKLMGSSPEIIVGSFVPDDVIVNLRNGHWYRAEYYYTGPRQLVTGIYSVNDKKLDMNFEPGKTYYIRCSIMKGMGMQSQLEAVDETTAKNEMKGLKEQKEAK
jgi:hypothetical protein